MTSRIPIASVALAALGTLAAVACVPRPEETPLEPMGRLPGLVTTAEPEWIPFQVAAGADLPADPREERISEPRAIPIEGQARRVAWAPDARSLLVEVKPEGSPCEEAWEVPLDRRPARRVSGAGSRARIGAFVGPGRVVLAESACREASVGAPWSIVEVDVSAGSRRTLATPDGEALAATTDGRFAYFATRGAGGKKDRMERVTLAGGGTPLLVADCSGLDAASVARASVVFGCKDASGAVQLVSASDEGGMAAPWSGGSQVDVDPALSPDGHTLAFASARAARGRDKKPADGPFQIYVAPFARRETAAETAERLTFAGGNNRAPAFGPHGRIAYLSDRGAPGGPLGVVVARIDAP